MTDDLSPPPPPPIGSGSVSPVNGEPVTPKKNSWHNPNRAPGTRVTREERLQQQIEESNQRLEMSLVRAHSYAEKARADQINLVRRSREHRLIAAAIAGEHVVESVAMLLELRHNSAATPVQLNACLHTLRLAGVDMESTILQTFDLVGETVEERMAEVSALYARGDITANEHQTLMSGLTAQSNVIKAAEEEKLRAYEEAEKAAAANHH